MKVQLRSKVPDASIEALVGTQARPEHAALSLTGNATVYKPNGELLLMLLKGAVGSQAADAAYPFLHGLRGNKTQNRGAYGLTRHKPLRVRKDGVLSNTNEALLVRSCVVGFMDRYVRIPFCRACALSEKDPEAWGTCLPLITQVAGAFEQTVPERYNAQLAAAKKTHPAYVIPGTPFTTLTVNNTVAGGYHRDAGDFKPGFGVMAVLRRGSYRGCELVLPAYGVSVNLEDHDLVLFDVHEVHGNTPFVDAVGPEGEPEDGGHERISIVFYYRAKMIDCLSPAQELARAKQARGNLKVPAETQDEEA